LAFAQQTEEVPDDVALAIAVAGSEIMHRPTDPQLATVNPLASKALNADPFKYERFGISTSVLQNIKQGAEGPNSRQLAAVIQLADPVTRRAALSAVSLNYKASGSNFEMTAARLRAVEPPDPRILLYFVPTVKIQDAGQAIFDDWNTLFTFVTQNAVPVGQKTERSKHYGFVFCMDRLSPDARLYPIVSRKKNEKSMSKAIAKWNTIDYNGWKVSIVAGRMQLGNAGKRFYMNIFYKPGSYAPERVRKTKRIGRFDSANMTMEVTAPQSKAQTPATGNTRPAPAPAQQPVPVPVPQQAPAPAPLAAPATAPQAAPAPAPLAAPAPAPLATPAPAPQAAPAPAPAPAPQAAPAQPAQGPLERGMAFLNPVFPEDVEVIQQRLKQLGHYKGPIDKNFGPGTKRALDNYAVKYGFPKGQWSLGLQKQLFMGTGM